jgi:hypothetical protein
MDNSEHWQDCCEVIKGLLCSYQCIFLVKILLSKGSFQVPKVMRKQDH